MEANRQNRKWDIVKEIIFFLLTTALAFAYWMLVFLLISFLTLSYIHFTIEGIYALAIVGTIGNDIWYIIRKIKQYRKRSR